MWLRLLQLLLFLPALPLSFPFLLLVRPGLLNTCLAAFLQPLQRTPSRTAAGTGLCTLLPSAWPKIPLECAGLSSALLRIQGPHGLVSLRGSKALGKLTWRCRLLFLFVVLVLLLLLLAPADRLAVRGKGAAGPCLTLTLTLRPALSCGCGCIMLRLSSMCPAFAPPPGPRHPLPLLLRFSLLLATMQPLQSCGPASLTFLTGEQHM
jgi:hypothetical protein